MSDTFTVEELSEAPGEHTKRVLLVEDHPALREALAIVLEREGFEVAAQVGSSSEARSSFEGRRGGVDVAVVDLHLPDGNGAQVIREFLKANPGASALVLTASVERSEWGEAVSAGASGILEKSASIAQIVEAVGRLANGEELLSKQEALGLVRASFEKGEQERLALFAASRLTPRERQILRTLAEGLDDAQIARRLGVSPATVHAHLVRLYSKLGVHSRLAAAAFAIRHNLVEFPY